MTTYLKKLCCIVFLLFGSIGTTAAQEKDGLVALEASVPGIVQVSAFPITKNSEDAFEIQYTNKKAGAVVIKISGSRSEKVNIPIRLQIRSNIAYDLSALLSSPSSSAVKIFVLDAATTGRMTAVDAVQGILINPFSSERFYFSRSNGKISDPGIEVGNTEIVFLKGPKISLAGSTNSPDNALEILLNAQITPSKASQNWMTEITVSAVPAVSIDKR
jgi:hypothetical protein